MRRASVLGGLSALCWLDWTALCHRLRRILKDPKRLWPWLLFVAWLVVVLIGRMTAGDQQSGLAGAEAAGPVVGALIPAVYVIIFGLVWQAAAKRAPAALSAPADGHFLLASDIPARAVVLWLQMRQAWGLTRGVALNAVIWLAIFLPTAGVSVHGVLLGLLAILCAAVLLVGMRLPVFVLARRAEGVPIGPIGTAVAALGGGMLLYQIWSAFRRGGTFAASLSSRPVHVPLGSSVSAAISGQASAIALLVLLALLATVLSVLAADDVYPEIWEASNRAFAVRRLARRGRFGGAELRGMLGATGESGATRRVPRSRTDASGGAAVPGGAWVVLWREWLGLLRSPSGLRGAALWLLGAAVAGVAIGVISARQGGSAAVGMISGFAIYPALFLATASGVSLAADLRRPIWWLAEESLAKRLLVWTFATSLKGIALIAVGLVAALVAAHTAATAVALLPLGAAVVWLLRAIGLCVYALLPSQTDLRGPGALLRIVLTLLLVIPAGIVAAAVGVLTQSQGAVMLTGAGAAALEGGVMVLWAARRLRGNGMAVAQAEQR